MSIWRAPLLILGILLILLAAGALALPWLVDFNRYKPQLQRWATELAGREVRIDGDVELVLFPWPAARLRDVSVAGAPGSEQRPLLRVREIRARLSLAALFAARVEVERLALIQPVLRLEHYGGGRGNWELAPRRQARLPFSARRVSFDSVQVEDGRLLLADYRRRGVLEIGRIDARISAPRLVGPWRLRGRWHMLGRDWQVRASTGVWQTGGPLSVSLRMEPPDGAAGHLVRLDGELTSRAQSGEAAASATADATAENGSMQPRFVGKLLVQPVIAQGRADPLDPAAQVELDGEIRLTPDMAELRDMKIVPRFAAASPFEELRGQARLTFGPVLAASVSLRTPRLALGPALARLLKLPGLQERQEAGNERAGESPEDALIVLRRLLRAVAGKAVELPPDVLLELDVQAARVLLDGRAFSRLSLAAEVSSELVMVNHLRADAPGAAELSFRGSLLGGDLLQLTGELDVRSDDARALLFGLWPDARKALAGAWRGSGGRLRLLATLDLTDYALRMVSRHLRLDRDELALDWRLNEPGKGQTGRSVAIDITAKRLALDGLLGAGNGTRPAAQLLRLVQALHPLGTPQRAREGAWRLHAVVDRLRLAGLTWRGVEVALRREAGELRMPVLKVADVGGLKLDGSGRLPLTDDDVRGELKMRLRGERAAAIWLLLGHYGLERAPPEWLQKLGAVDLNLLVDARTSSSGASATDTQNVAGTGARLELALDGSAGPLRVSVSLKGMGGEVAGKAAEKQRAPASAWGTLWHGRWQGRLELHAEQADAVMAIAGLRGVLPAEEGRADMTLRVAGVPADGLTGEGRVALPGARVSVRGEAGLASRAGEDEGTVMPPPLRGRLAVDVALDDAARWARVVGGVAVPSPLPLTGGLTLRFSPRRWVVSKMVLRTGENRLAGELTLDWPEDAAVAGVERTAPLLRGKVLADELDAEALFVALLGDVDDPHRLRADMAAGWDVDLEVQAARVRLPLLNDSMPKVRLSLRRDERQDAGRLRATLRAGTEQDVELQARVAMRRVALGLETEGTLHASWPLWRLARTADGQVGLRGRGRLQLSVKGRPASLRGMLTALAGDGRLQVERGWLRGVSPTGLLKVVRSIGTQTEVEQFDKLARAALLDPAARWPLPEGAALKLLLRDGLLELMPLTYAHAGLRTEVSGAMDLARRRLDVAFSFAEEGGRSVPPFSITLAGAPGALSLLPELDDLREWAQQQVIRRKEEEVRRLERRRRMMEEQARKLEEAARREMEERRRQEEMRQRARALHEKLQEVLAAAHARMQAREKPPADERGRRQEGPVVGAPEGGAGKPQGGEAAVVPQENERPSGRRPGKAELTIEELIREAQEEAAAERAATRNIARGAGKEGEDALPDAARALPRGFASDSPRPRPRPALRLQPRQVAERKRPNGGKRVLRRRNAAGNGQSGKAAGGNGQGRAGANGGVGRKATAGQGARQVAQPEPTAPPVRLDPRRPLTNWNRFAPAR